MRVFTLAIMAWLVTMGVSAEYCRAQQNGSGTGEKRKGILLTEKADGRWVEEKTGQYLPLDLTFVDERGKSVSLGEFIDRPTILLPIYFYCPNICSKNLANLAVSLGSLTAVPGKDYRVIALSFNEAETAETAARAKTNYLKIVGESFPEKQWKFLTGTEEAIKAATDAVGFKFKKKDDKTFIHPAALMIIAADGKIIRYVYGSFLAGDIDMALVDAAEGKPSLSVKRFLSFCFNFDPDKNKTVFQYVKIGVLLFFFAVLSFIFLYFKKRKTVGKKENTDLLSQKLGKSK